MTPEVVLLADPLAARRPNDNPAAGAGTRRLFDAATEYLETVRRTRDLPGTRAVPDDLIILLYAYEIVERLRDVSLPLAGAATIVVPFDPHAALAAAGVKRSCLDALMATPPGPRVLYAVERPTDVIAQAAEIAFGRLPFDPAAYVEAVEEAERARRLAVRRDDRRRTAAAMIVHRGRVLFERRPFTKPVTPGVWDIPGGHVEDGESAREALVREMREELDIDVIAPRLLHVIDANEPPHGVPYRHFIYRVDRRSDAFIARENQTLAWMTPAEASAETTLNPTLIEPLRALAMRPNP